MKKLFTLFIVCACIQMTNANDKINEHLFFKTTSTFHLDNLLKASNSDYLIFKINDETPTAECPANQTVNNDPNSCDAIVTFTLPPSSGPVTTTAAPASGSTFPVGITTVTVTADDGAGNTDQCTFTVTVNDTEIPTLTCPPNVVETALAGQCEATVNYNTSYTITDNCTPAVVESIPSGSAFGVGTTPVTVTVTDPGSNSVSCSINIVVTDDENPVAICPANITANADSGSCDTEVEFNLGLSTDNCKVLTEVSDYASGSIFPVGVTTVTVTATDPSNNMDDCTFTITVNDAENPVAACPADVTVNNDSGVCNAVATFDLPASSDNCSGVISSASPASGSTFNVGVTVVTVTAEDASGNLNSCTFNVTVNDTEDPVAACPADITVNNDTGFCHAAVSFIIPAPTDNCSGVTSSASPASGSTFNVGVTVVTVTAEDASGNLNSCTFNVTVNDVEDPMANCPADFTVNNDPGSCDAIVNYTLPAATDNCSVVSTVAVPASGSVIDVGVTETVIVTVTDAAGNTDMCTFRVTVEDNEDPVAICPDDIEVDNDSGLCNAVVNFTIPDPTDNCSATSSASPASGSTFNEGETIVTVTAVDDFLNDNECEFTVTVNDVEAPTISCPPSVIQNNDSGLCTAVVNYNTEYTVTDNCTTTVVESIPSGSEFGVGITVVTVTATDEGNNSVSCNIDIVVVDAEDPTAICPTDIVALTDSGSCDAVVDFDLGLSTDNCKILSEVSDFASGSTFPVGVTTVTVTATDTSNNMDDCTFTITVNDGENPVANCPDNIEVNNDASSCDAVVNFPLPVSTDNCSVVTTVAVPASGSTFSVGVTAVTVTATDDAGNMGTCSFNVTVNDIEDPMASCQDVTVQLDASGVGSIVASDVNNGSTDNCGIASLAVSPSSFDCTNLSTTNTVTLTVTDNSGNTNTCTSSITVEDNIAPTAICPTDFTIDNDPSWCGVFLDITLPESTDNCEVSTTVADVPNGTFIHVGPPETITITATDSSGNTDNCTFTVTVVDVENPMVMCPADVSVDTDPGLCLATNVTYTLEDAMDNCANPLPSSADFPSGSSFSIGSTTVTVSATDAAGNTANCTFTVTVNDTEDPMASCQDVTVQLDASGLGSITASDVNNGSTDNCGIAGLAVNPSTFDCTNLSTVNTVTLTVTDNSGNTNTCTSSITVEDNIAPTAVCPTDFTVDNEPSYCGAFLDITLPVSTDNCEVSTTVADVANGTFIPVGVPETITITATDSSGNIDQCSFTVTAIDVENPMVMCPADVTVNCDPGLCLATSVTYTLEDAMDNCFNPLPSSADIPSGSSFPVGLTTVTVSATDAAGNTGSCTFIATVIDNIAPTAICQDVTVQLDASGVGSIVASDVNNGSTDNCGIASLAVSPSSVDCTNIGANAVTLTVTDDSGNTNTCSAIATVQDNIAPTAVCQDITIQLDAAGNATIVASDVDGGSTDACGIATLSVSQTTFDCSHIGTNPVTLTVTDVNSNTADCTATVTVEDNIAPTAVCQDITIQLDAAGNATIVASDVDGGSTDACGIATLSVSQTTFDCSHVGTNPVTLTVTDVNSNTADCTATVTVEDNIAPTAVCQDITIQLDAAGNATIVASDVDGGSTDACGIATLSVSQTTFDCSHVGTNPVTLTVTDVNSNTADCTATVTVEDNIAPTAVCQDITIQLDAAGNGTIVASDVDGGSTDACGIATLSVSQTTFDCSHVGTNPVTLTVTDVNSNTADCTATVTVEDNIAPTAVCQDITIQLDAAGNGTIVASDVDGGSTDACGIATLSVSQTTFDCSHVGTNPVTLTVTDVNSNTADCTATVTVEDNIAPTAVCQDITIQLDAAGNATIVASDVDGGSTDACGIATLSVSQTTFDCSHVGTNPVTLTVTDVNSNTADCTATVTVEDNIAPTAVCQDITIQLDAAGNATIVASDVDGGSTDACGIATLSVSQTTFDCSHVGTNPVTLTVTDVNSNTADCTATVTVEDNIAPTAVCQDITIQLDAAGNATIVASDVDGGSTDACGIATLSVSQTTFDCSHVGTNPVTLTVTDVNSNTADCTATVTVEDNIAPTAVCQDITIQLDAAGNATIVASDVDGGSTDACGIATLSVSQTAFDCSHVGTNPVTLTVTDVNSNTADCTATVTVEDNIAPTAVCQDITIQLDAAGNATIVASDVDGGSTDACGIATLSVSQTTFDCSHVGTNPVTLTVTDVNSNTADCTATVTVEDNIAPTAVCQDITIQLDAAGNATIVASDVDGGSTDACGIATLSVSQTTFDCSHVGTNPVTLTVTDVNSNTADCTATVTVEDNIAPTAVCQDITIQLDAAGNATIVASDVDGGSTDACGIATLSVSQTTFDCSHVGTNPVTLTVTDVNSNTADCTATVTVEDNIAPTAVCQDITIQLDAAGNATIVASDVDGGSTDACGIATLSVSQTTFDCSHVGTNPVTLTVTDVNSNTADCTATVTVEDNIAPTAVCQDITIQLDAAGNATIVASDVDGGSTDACGIATLSVSQTTFDCSHVGTNPVTLTVTDVNSNTADCTATVTVEDNIAPTAVCQDITIQLDAAGNGTIVASDVDGGSTDACGIATLSVSQTTFDCSHVGTNPVTLTVTDVNSNTADCTATVTVEDNIAPTAVCQDITIQLDAAGNATIVASDVDGGSTDACGIATLSVSQTTFDCSHVGTNPVTLTVTDVNSNTADCTATVTVEDNIAPVLNCPDIVIYLDPGLCGTNVDYDVESTDNCEVDTEETISGPLSGTYLDYHDGPWAVTVEVTDVNGNVSTCDFNIIINEYANPIETLACNDQITIALDEDGCSTVGADMLLEGGPYGCYDDYIVDINFEGDEVCCDDIDETLYYTVTDPDTGNSCSGYIEVFDEISPYCDFEEEIVVSCIDEIPSPEDTQSSIGFYDNCGVESIFLVSEAFEDDDICDSVGEMVIVRIWGATDESGNEATELCEQHIVIEREDVFFPADADFDCSSYTLDDLDPSLTGYPTAVQSSTCAYEYTYSDVVLPNCGGLSKVIRTWTVLDLCTGEIITEDDNGLTNEQVITIYDDEGPQIDASDIQVSTDSDQCAFTGFIVLPSITDNCTGVSSIQMFVSGVGELDYVYGSDGALLGGNVPSPGASLGVNNLKITAVDSCGNFSESEINLTVFDEISPTVICDEITQVSLTTDGTALVFAETFDDGSYDNCCLDGFEVTRMDDGNFGPSVLFDCADINTSIQVILRVHDCHGNSNECMVEVLVEDKINPYLNVPANTDLSCDEYYADLAAELDAGNDSILETMFGSASAEDNCEVFVDYTYTYSVDQCGVGSITRTWVATDQSGNGPVAGSQTIGIYHVSDWSITFPTDLTVNCADGQLPDFGEPVVSDDNCENIAISYTDTQYDVVPDACYKIVREWEAINWCTYPDESAQTAIQVISIIDDEAPVFDVEDMTVEITESDCDTPVTLPAPDVTDCSDDITITTTSDLPAGEAGPGTYTANYVVTDGCGNVSYDQITITVVDAKKPTPYLTDELVTEIMQTGMTLTVEAEDFDIGSFDNCSDVTLSFSPDVTDTERVFDCSQLGPNTLEVWVTDAAGNQDYVTVTLTVQDNMNVCGPGTLTVAGALTTEGGDGIEYATVEINGGLFNHTTDETGTYSFDLNEGADYSVVPSLDLDAGNGVTTFDMVLITQHILGMNTFTNPYQLIAADANNSNTITTLDLVAIRMVILQMTDAFPNNTSWRFVDADHVFADPTDPWGYPEVINYNNLDVEDLAADFIGVKIGDVNGTAQANFQSPAENRTNKNIQINTTDEQVQASQEVTVHFTSAAAVAGYQFTLNHEGLELVSIQEGLARAEHFGVHAGALTASWNDMEIRNLEGEDLFSVTFKATTDVQLSEVLTINSRYTQAEAYTTQGIEGVELTFSGQSNTDYVLYQNVPNPFNGQTTIGFDLAKAGQASLRIMTIDGQTVKSINGDFVAGYNEVIIKDLRAVGVLYYSLESGDFTATKKMIVIE